MENTVPNIDNASRISGDRGFLAELSQYYYRENDLSNITVALCKGSMFFKRRFLCFFFPGMDVEHVKSIEREVPDDTKGDSRVDIKIMLDNDVRPYLIEVKINDKGQHVQQYIDSYQITHDHFGYIVNYEFKDETIEIKQWRELYLDLKKNLDNCHNEPDVQLVLGYLAYIKNVCSIIEYENAMKLENLEELHHFFDVAARLLKIEEDIYSVRPTKVWTPTSGLKLAPYTCLSFEISYSDMPTSSIYGELFLYYGPGYTQPEVYMGIQPNSVIVRSKIDGGSIFREGKTFFKPEIDKDDGWYVWEHLWFEMRKVHDFLETEDQKAQEELLRDFISEVIAAVAR